MTARPHLLLTVVVTSLGLTMSLPSPLMAGDATRTGFDPWTAASTPVESALSGGTLALRSPGTQMILVRRSTFRMGTTDTEALDAKNECILRVDRRGCDDQAFSNAAPSHTVTLSSYWMDRLEVTVRDYRRCVQVGRCEPIPYGEGARRFDRPDYPVSLVTWSDARDYCAFRNARLPTEAEFERAASGTTHRVFPWGNKYNSHVSNHGRGALPETLDPLGGVPGVATIFKIDATDAFDGFTELAPVGSFPAGATRDGFLDLAGNVAEWVSDWYQPQYPEHDVVDPIGPSSSPVGTRVVRGGSYLTGAPWLRTTSRAAASPRTRETSLGFRCAKSAAHTPSSPVP